MFQPRKVMTIQDVVTADAFGTPCEAVTRVAIAAVLRNPMAGRHQDDLSDLFDIGGAFGDDLAARAAAMLPKPAVSYGKAAIVGVNGDMEQGGALIHPKLGRPMRAAVGGGEAVIPSNVKLGGPGTSIDVPLGHKDLPWSFDHFDTLTLVLPDAPLPDEIVVILAYADGGRPIPRCGSGPQTTS